MALSCPNKSLPEWKRLVDEVGEREALNDYFQFGTIRSPYAVKDKLERLNIANYTNRNFKIGERYFKPTVESLIDVEKNSSVVDAMVTHFGYRGLQSEEDLIKRKFTDDIRPVETVLTQPTTTTTKSQITEPVSELFESNPELANAVYKAVGFYKNNKTVNFSDTDVKEEVYHSSNNEFNEFKQGKDGAIHFGDKKAATERTNKSSKKYLKKVKLKVNNLVESVDSVDFEGILKDKESKIYIVEKLRLAKTETQEHLIALFANEKITKEQLEQYWDSSLETIYKEIFNADGYSYINLAENKGSKSYVVFNPNQIEIIEDGEIKYNENTKEYEYVNTTNQITPQQKQEAQQLYSKYLDTIFPDSKVAEMDNSLYISVLNQLEQENKIEKDCTGAGRLKAEKGLATSFTKGSQWEIVKDLKGYPSHSQGGVDIKLGKDGFSFARNGGQIMAAHGLVLPKIK